MNYKTTQIRKYQDAIEIALNKITTKTKYNYLMHFYIITFVTIREKHKNILIAKPDNFINSIII